MKRLGAATAAAVLFAAIAWGQFTPPSSSTSSTGAQTPSSVTTPFVDAGTITVGSGDVTLSSSSRITLGNASTSHIRAGASALLRMDDAIGVFLQYSSNNYMLMDSTNIEFSHVNGTLIVTGDTTTPAKPAFRITPQDAQPSGPNVVGDMYVTTAGLLKICTVAGTPGTWVSVGAQ